MANKYASLTSLFTAIANAIRAKTGSAETIVADDFPEAIEGQLRGSEIRMFFTMESANVTDTVINNGAVYMGKRRYYDGWATQNG